MESKVAVKDWLVLFVIAIACLSVGAVSGMSASSASEYGDISLPPLSPPGVVFPIAWTVLYVLMALSLWVVYMSGGDRRFYALFAAQLILNFIWVPLFFGADMMAVALVDMVLLWVTVAASILVVRDNVRTAAYLLIPYMLWLTFAAYLNIGALILN